MERVCEFCAAPGPIVFCKADSAFLCLSCDAKVHSANALSSRHFRCLVCESCRQQPAHIRCLEHRFILCRSCDSALHQNTIKHQRRMVSSFTGSPSAKQFAILWGFDLNQLAQIAGPSTSSISAASVSSHVEQNKISGKGQHESRSFVMQQILDLNRLQLNQNNYPSTIIRERGQPHSPSSCVYDNTVGRIDERESSGPNDEINALKGEHFVPLPLSQSEYLSCYTSTALESNQFWPQNMEEPRVCEELDESDDLKMPELDMTFPNFEELLWGDQDLSRALLEDDANAFFSSETDPQSADATRNMAPSFMHMDQMNNEENQFAHQGSQKPKSFESKYITEPSYSCSLSHLSAETSSRRCHDSGSSEDLHIEGNGNVFSATQRKLSWGCERTRQSQMRGLRNQKTRNGEP